MPNLPQLFDLSGRSAIITGGAGLLGSEFCKTLAAAGAAVTVADIDEDAAQQLNRLLTDQGYRAQGLRVDVTSVESVCNMVDTTLEAYNSIDILVNCAALDPKFDPRSKLTITGGFEDFPIEIWKKALDINLTGVVLCCQSVIKAMLSRNGGVIINIASIYGVVAPDQRLYQQEDEPPQYKPAYYSVTKAGLLGLTRYLASYYAGKNIRVNALTPGGVFNKHQKDFVDSYSARTILGRMAEVDEMNGALLFLASDASSYMTGANLIVDGGWTTW